MHAAGRMSPATRFADWKAGLCAGLIAGLIDQGLLILLMLAQGTSPWIASRATAAILLGPGVLEGPERGGSILAAAFVVHFALSLVYGLVIAALIRQRSAGEGIAIGIAFGLAVWVLNYFVVAPSAFPWFVPMRAAPMTPALHAVFGLAAAGAYLALRTSERRRGFERRHVPRKVTVERRGFDDRRSLAA